MNKLEDAAEEVGGNAGSSVLAKVSPVRGLWDIQVGRPGGPLGVEGLGT